MSEMIELYEELEKTCNDIGLDITSITYKIGNKKFYDIGIEESEEFHQPTVTREEYDSLVAGLMGEPFNLSADNSKEIPQYFNQGGENVLKMEIYFPSKAPDKPFKITRIKISKDYEKRKEILDHLVASLKISNQAKDDKTKK